MRRFTLIAIIIGLIGCGKPDPNRLTVGTIAGPETDLVLVAKDVALKQYGLNVKVVEFSDYNLPNEALEDGSLDANVYQHRPYLNAAKKAHGYHFDVIGKTFVYPAGIYSQKVNSLQGLRDKGIIAIPNDPSNGSRALLLLQKAGLITLKKDTQTIASIRDIESNPKQLIIKELDAAQLPRILSDVDAAVINTTFAIPAGLHPSQDALFTEDKDSPYANLIVIRHDNSKTSQLNHFVKAMNSPQVEAKANELFGDAAISAW